MSVRYYLISFLVVMGLTLVISWLRQTRTTREFLIIFAAVAGGLGLLALLIAVLSKLLVDWGIAESGFIF